jgi:hypothetical protein
MKDIVSSGILVDPPGRRVLPGDSEVEEPRASLDTDERAA